MPTFRAKAEHYATMHDRQGRQWQQNYFDDGAPVIIVYTVITKEHSNKAYLIDNVNLTGSHAETENI